MILYNFSQESWSQHFWKTNVKYHSQSTTMMEFSNHIYNRKMPLNSTDKQTAIRNAWVLSQLLTVIYVLLKILKICKWLTISLLKTPYLKHSLRKPKKWNKMQVNLQKQNSIKEIELKLKHKLKLYKNLIHKSIRCVTTQLLTSTEQSGRLREL